ncbi:hypothetical protein BCR35DRAFT_330532 [Leucosporidium creatinivorum]|uniref:Polysaccharide lyase 14 domain-containing protein n=1 Tax=Leucosporidium creatinivorum TaxID=106004 RepID=A0A1Y2FRR4_9BASI|nr:hypothetical protein BCR35DRAFT_330532 [Leucosporidium creatinivorum]
MPPRDSEALLYSVGRGQGHEDTESDDEEQIEEEEEEQRPRKTEGFSNRTILLVVGVLVLVAVALGGVAWVLKSKSGSSPTSTAADSASQDTSSRASVATPSGSGLAATLASSFSLTPASMPTLAFPDSPISSALDALDFISSNWALVTGNSDYISFVDDPFPSSSSSQTGTVLAVEFPAGSYAGHGPDGGIMGAILNVFGDGANVAFSDNFGWVKGGKLPGLFGGDHEDFMPTSLATTAFCDDEMECNETYVSINRGSWTFTAGGWNTISEVAILNSDPSTPTEANGILSMYIGSSSEAVFTRSNVVFRTNSDVTFTAVFLSSFFGGSSDSFASEGGTAYFRNFQIYAGEEPSSSSGDSVSAEVPS